MDLLQINTAPVDDMIEDVPPPGDASKVEQALLKFDWENVALAKAVMAQVLIDADSDKATYDAIPGNVSESNAEKQGRDPKTPKCANQSDMIRAQYNSMLFEASDTFSSVAKQMVDQPKADVSISLIKDVWRDYGMELEIDDSLWDYLNAPYGGLKTVVVTRNEPTAVIKEIAFNDMAIAQFEAQMEQAGTPFQVISVDDHRKVVVYETVETRQTQDCIGKAIDVTTLYVTDRKFRKINDSPSVHESHVWDYEQIESQAGFINLDLLGAPNANGRVRPTDQIPNQENLHGQTNETNNNFEFWELFETWGCVPWGRMMRKEAFSYQDLERFAEKYSFKVSQCGRYDESGSFITLNQRWQRFHKEKDAYYKFTTSFLFKKTEYPYHIGSFISARREMFGCSYLRRIREWEAMFHAIASMLSDNVRQKLYGGVIVDSLSGLDKKKVQDIKNRDSLIELELGSRRFEEVIKFWAEISPDVGPMIAPFLNLVQNELQTYGVSDIFMGQGDSETATQDTINMKNSTSKVTHPLRRYMTNILIPCVEQIRDFNHENFTGERWISSQAEGGAMMAKEQRPVTRADLTNRFRVISAVNYDYASRPAKVSHILAALNIAAKVISPKAFYKMLAAAMQLMEIDRELIDAVTGDEGRGTDFEDEVASMDINKWAAPAVREDDDHLRAVMVLNDYAEKKNAEDPGGIAGTLFMGQDNVTKWNRDHLFLLNQQLAEMEMAKEMQGGPKGNPKQQPKSGPDGEEGQARQGAQHGSPADNAPPGMTGQASVAAMAQGNASVPTGEI